MFYVLGIETHETIAMTRREDVAKMIAEMAIEPCVIRWSEK